MAIKYKINVLQALKEKGYNTSRLRQEKLLGESTIQQLRLGQLVSWTNVDRLCTLLDCQIGDIFENANKDEEIQKKEAFEIPTSTKSGIYMIYNLNNHKIYIGETQNFKTRASQHRKALQNNIHSNKEMQEDYNEGCEFYFVILESFDEGYNRDYLLKREKQYIYAFKDKSSSVYNHETRKQLEHNMFYDYVTPVICDLQNELREKFSCHIPTLERCNINTLKEKFEQINKGE